MLIIWKIKEKRGGKHEKIMLNTMMITNIQKVQNKTNNLRTMYNKINLSNERKNKNVRFLKFQPKFSNLHINMLNETHDKVNENIQDLILSLFVARP